MEELVSSLSLKKGIENVTNIYILKLRSYENNERVLSTTDRCQNTLYRVQHKILNCIRTKIVMNKYHII